MQSFTSIPFKTKTDSGMSNINGVAKFSSAGIVLEFESKLLGLISTGVKEARLPISELLDVKFKKGMMKRGAKIEIRLNSFAQISSLPHNDGKVTLKLGSDDFARARDAVEAINQEMTQHAATLPPPHPPIASLFDGSEDDTKELDQ